MALVEAPHLPLRDVRLNGGLLGLVRVIATFRVLAAMTLAVTYFQVWHVAHETEVDVAAITAAAPAASTSAAVVPSAAAVPSANEAAVDTAPDLAPPRRDTGRATTCTGFGHFGGNPLPAVLAAAILALALFLYFRPTLSSGMLSAAGTIALALLVFRVTLDPGRHLLDRVEPRAGQALFGLAFVLLALTSIADLCFHPILYMWARRDQAPRA